MTSRGNRTRESRNSKRLRNHSLQPHLFGPILFFQIVIGQQDEAGGMARIIPRRTWRRDAAHALSKWVIGCVVGYTESEKQLWVLSTLISG